jgi:1-acyl-sn-glycerol-3-phosphate acyltransferase
MKKETYTLKYPRRVFVRKTMTLLGRLLLALLAGVEINGKEKLPKQGPIILAGNHVAVLEAVMMAVYTPGMVEFIGNGDIPFDPNYAGIVNAYDLIPVNRGNLDRQGLNLALDVLAQNGILGIFPEGGHWDPANMQAQIGVAWLSHRSGAPILPIGFGGIKEGLKKALRLKRPKLVMNVGELIPPVTHDAPSLSARENFEMSANKIMAAINSLVPEENLEIFRRRVDEAFTLEIGVRSDEVLIPIPADLRIKHGSVYARFLYNPTMMDVLVRNLHLPINPLREIFRRSELDDILQAWQSILDYLQTNPGYFTYRFGVQDGLAVKKALVELIKLGQWIQESGFSLTIEPIRSYRNAKTGAQVIERGGCFPESM